MPAKDRVLSEVIILTPYGGMCRVLGMADRLDYSVWADAWLTSSGDPNYDEMYDFDSNSTVATHDLGLFSSIPP